jgi:hypothetical protein
MEAYKMVVLTNPVPGREEEYNAWYDGRHLDDVLRCPGFVAAQRFDYATSPGSSTDAPSHKYLAIYDIESDDLAATFETFLKVTNTDAMPISPALAPDAVPIVYKVRGEKKTAPV